MTVISAMFSKLGIAVATDSMLSAIDENGDLTCIEWQQSKIVVVPKLKACISYWGFAGALKGLPKKNKPVEWIWRTYEWLQKESSNPKFFQLEDFSKNILEKLDKQLQNIHLARPEQKGIGLHIAGLEKIDGYVIPELFLVSNYSDPSYQNIKELGLSRNTYHTIFNVPPATDHSKKEYRFAVKDSLRDGRIITYNNGDPILFNLISSVIHSSFEIASKKKILRNLNTVEETVPIVKRPIEIISN
ncbi:hypothetical protein KJ766_00325 [Patescibacteria group bacterium]|nr:hypothetical protein [Patescibacteria group bacterium]MBU1718901.1 hypothetical protein [Bacteroidota bacterium]